MRSIPSWLDEVADFEAALREIDVAMQRRPIPAVERLIEQHIADQLAAAKQLVLGTAARAASPALTMSLFLDDTDDYVKPLIDARLAEWATEHPGVLS